MIAAFVGLALLAASPWLSWEFVLWRRRVGIRRRARGRGGVLFR